MRNAKASDSREDTRRPTIAGLDSDANWRNALEKLPPRTRFYALAPLGIGKPAVESLSNYVLRLASAHSVGLTDLARDLKLVEGEATYQQLKSPVNAFNGGAATRLWLPALEEATNIRDLRFMTMLPFESLLSLRRTYHKFRRWCPGCYEDSRKLCKVTYDPLLWSISSVNICPIHLTVLEGACLACGRQMRFFSAFMRAGHCSHCGSWLGRIQSSSPMSGDEFERCIWYAKAVGSLLSIGSQLADESKAALFIENWRACVNIVAKRFVSGILQVCGISCTTRYHILTDPPVMDVFLRICFGLKIEVESLIDNKFDPHRLVPYFSQSIQGMDLPRSPISRTELRVLLEEALYEDSTPSLTQLAERWGYSGINRLREVDPELCKKIAKRNRQPHKNARPWRAMSQEKLRKSRALLEEAIYQENPHPCGTIAKQIGCDVATLRARFPELCISIDRKIEEAKQSRLARAQQLLESALIVSPVPCLHALTKQAGYRCSTSLKQNFPELCERLLQRANSERTEKNIGITLKLESYLGETPPPTGREITRRVLLSEATLAESYPKLMRLLASRSQKYKSKSVALRRSRVYKEVKEIVEADFLNGRITVYGERLLSLISEDGQKSWTLVWKAPGGQTRSWISGWKLYFRVTPSGK